MNIKLKSWMVSWLSLKTKVEPGLRESRAMSGNWRRLHQVRGVSSGSPENHRVPWFIHKAKTKEPRTEVQQYRTGLTGGYRSDGARNGARVLHTSMAKTTRCGEHRWRHFSVERVRSFGMSRWTQAMSSR
jgi:hypothetical protein